MTKLARSCISLDLFEEFKLEREPIGAGSQAIVYLCHRKTDRNIEFALKCFRKSDLKEDTSKIADMLGEIDILRAIRHKSVVKLHGVYETDNHVCLLLPYLKGGALFDEIRRKSVLQEADARPIMQSLLTAVKYLHERRIVHRDLKPDNLLLK